MSKDEIALKHLMLEHIKKNIPKRFFVELQERFKRAYHEEYLDVSSNLTTLPEQKLFKLAQNRCFRLDWELIEAANRHGLANTAKELAKNKWCHAYVSSGIFGLTQSNVAHYGDFPKPAKYRDALAEAAENPRFPLDCSSEIFDAKRFYGIIVHNSVGRRFTEEHQKLGSLMFCVPDNEMKNWNFALAISELISLYPLEVKETKTIRSPIWKKAKGTGTEE